MKRELRLQTELHTTSSGSNRKRFRQLDEEADNLEMKQLTSEPSSRTMFEKTSSLLSSIFNVMTLRASHANTFRGGESESAQQGSLIKSALIVGYILAVLLISGLARA